jgi:hypothetical protein
MIKLKGKFLNNFKKNIELGQQGNLAEGSRKICFLIFFDKYLRWVFAWKSDHFRRKPREPCLLLGFLSFPPNAAPQRLSIYLKGQSLKPFEVHHFFAFLLDGLL